MRPPSPEPPDLMVNLVNAYLRGFRSGVGGEPAPEPSEVTSAYVCGFIDGVRALGKAVKKARELAALQLKLK